MVFSSPLGNLARGEIAHQIAAHLPASARFDAPGAAGPELGESLRLFFFNPDGFVGPIDSISGHIDGEQQWHHQVYVGDNSAGYARSIADGDDRDASHSVVEFGTSELPSDLKGGFDWIDENVSNDAQADIISVPSRFVTAIWIHGDGLDHILVVSQANALKLPKNRLIKSQEFAQELQASQPIEGLGPLPKNEV